MWARSDASALPQYTTNNVVAYPQEPDAAVRALCLLPEQLVKVLTAQFVGSDPSVVSQDPAVVVHLAHLRSALFWLVTHCWPWLEATKEHGLLVEAQLGPKLEALLARYRESLGGAEVLSLIHI